MQDVNLNKIKLLFCFVRKAYINTPSKITQLEKGEKTLQPDIASHFGDLKDPRVEGKNRHLLIDIIIIAICAVVSGASGWEQIEIFGKAKQEWLASFLELPNGVLGHAAELSVFPDMRRSLPTVEKILANQQTLDLPSDPAVLVALCEIVVAPPVWNMPGPCSTFACRLPAGTEWLQRSILRNARFDYSWLIE